MDEENEDFLDEEKLAEYFPLEHVIETTLEIYQELLSLKFRKIECQAWIENVPCYRVHDEESNELLGQFYLDVYPRTHKQGGAYVSSVMNRHNILDNKKKAVSYMMANFAKSGLLEHSDVSTFFHEFGHIMH